MGVIVSHITIKMIIEHSRLELQKEYRVYETMKQFIDIILLGLFVSIITAYVFHTILPLIPFMVLLMIYVIADDANENIKSENDVLINYAIKRNNFFESARDNTDKLLGYR